MRYIKEGLKINFKKVDGRSDTLHLCAKPQAIHFEDTRTSHHFSTSIVLSVAEGISVSPRNEKWSYYINRVPHEICDVKYCRSYPVDSTTSVSVLRTGTNNVALVDAYK